MGNYVALLRAVNVAGKNKVNMKKLKRGFRRRGIPKRSNLYPKWEPRTKFYFTNRNRSSGEDNESNQSDM